jgi:hypothetical protein
MEERIERLRALLDDLDELEPTEELGDLNATLEDVIFLLEEDEEAGADARAELSDLRDAYTRLGLAAPAARLTEIIGEMA